MRKAVNVIIEDGQGKILVLKRSPDDKSCPGIWDLPGGGVEKNETLQEAVKREVKEESGLEIESEKDYFYIRRHLKDKIIIYGFKAKLIGGNVALSKEHTESRWICKAGWEKLEYTRSVGKMIGEFFK